MNRLNLILHAGANKVEREQVANVVTPAATDSWVPIPHLSLVDMVERQLPDYGLQIVNTQYALMKDEHRFFSLMQIAEAKGGDGGSLIEKDYAFVLGLRNSHDKSFPAGLVVGSGVFVCDNLAFSGEIKIGRRHTLNIMRDLPTLVTRALGRLATNRIEQEKRIEAYKQTELTDKDAALLLMQSFDKKAVNKTRVTDAWQQWVSPNHPEFADKNVWRFMNAITEVSKGINPFELSNRTQLLHPLLDNACGIVVGSTIADDNVIDAEFTVNGRDQLA